MARTFLTTSQLAKAVQIHPNTVRLYEAWGFIAPAPRTETGYRMFSPVHLVQLRLARIAVQCTWVGGKIRALALEMVRRFVAGDCDGAIAEAGRLQQAVAGEREQTEAAARVLEKWAQYCPASSATPSTEAQRSLSLRIGEAAALLNTTVDALRSWERNGLVCVPRIPSNGYRIYGTPEIERLRVIRLLLRSRYSTMAVRRMLLKLDLGQQVDLRLALDTPDPEEDAIYVTDRWLSALGQVAEAARQALDLLAAEAVFQKTLH